MIEVHVFNAFLIGSLKEEGWFSALDYVNGLVAPSFLFVAGFVFVVVSDRKLEDFRRFGKAFWRQLSRIGLIWVIGYGLHLPFFSLYRTLYDSTPDQLMSFYQSDILHCIAIGMLIVFFGRILIKGDRQYQIYLITVGCLMVLVAPLIWDTDFSASVPGWLASYLNGQQRSMFPLFPWLGFLVFGAVAAFAHKKALTEGRETAYFRQILLAGAVMLAAGSVLIELPVRVPYVSTAIRANPLFFVSRLGNLLILLSACWYYAKWRKTERSFVLDAGRESLLIYTAHLLVIYGRFWGGRSIAFLYGESFTALQCAAATLGLAIVMIVVAKVWGWLKRTSLPWARYISYATGVVVLILFLVRKY
jgi:uncharacterized membrane protein